MADNNLRSVRGSWLSGNITGKPISSVIARDFAQRGHLRQQWQNQPVPQCQGGGWGTVTAWGLMALLWIPARDHTPVEELGQFQCVCLHPNKCKGFLSKQIFINLHYQPFPYAKTEGGFAEIQRRILSLNKFSILRLLFNCFKLSICSPWAKEVLKGYVFA